MFDLISIVVVAHGIFARCSSSEQIASVRVHDILSFFVVVVVVGVVVVAALRPPLLVLSASLGIVFCYAFVYCFIESHDFS